MGVGRREVMAGRAWRSAVPLLTSAAAMINDRSAQLRALASGISSHDARALAALLQPFVEWLRRAAGARSRRAAAVDSVVRVARALYDHGRSAEALPLARELLAALPARRGPRPRSGAPRSSAACSPATPPTWWARSSTTSGRCAMPPPTRTAARWRAPGTTSACAFGVVGRYELAARCFGAALSLLEPVAQIRGPARFVALANLADCRFHLGEVDEGLAHGERALRELAGSCRKRTRTPSSLLRRTLVRLLIARGRVEEAADHVAEAIALARSASVAARRDRRRDHARGATRWPRAAPTSHSPASTGRWRARARCRRRCTTRSPARCGPRRRRATPRARWCACRSSPTTCIGHAIERTRALVERRRARARGARGRARSEQARARLVDEARAAGAARRAGRRCAGSRRARCCAWTTPAGTACAWARWSRRSPSRGDARRCRRWSSASPRSCTTSAWPRSPRRSSPSAGRSTTPSARIVRTHPEAGAAMLVDDRHPRVLLARDIARYHHARWDGAGYPERVVGGGHPPRGAHVRDRRRLRHDGVRIRGPRDPVDGRCARRAAREAGRQFDPELVSCFDALIRGRTRRPGRRPVGEPGDGSLPGARRGTQGGSGIRVTNDLVIDTRSRGCWSCSRRAPAASALAKELGYQEGTMRVYLHNLYRKIGVGNKTEAVIWYLKRSAPAATPRLPSRPRRRRDRRPLRRHGARRGPLRRPGRDGRFPRPVRPRVGGGREARRATRSRPASAARQRARARSGTRS